MILRQIAQRGVAAIAYEHVRLWLRILIRRIRIHHLSCWLLRTLHGRHLLLKTLRPLLVRLRRYLLRPWVVLLLRHLLVCLLVSLRVLLWILLGVPVPLLRYLLAWIPLRVRLITHLLAARHAWRLLGGDILVCRRHALWCV